MRNEKNAGGMETGKSWGSEPPEGWLKMAGYS
jgi:hypothetical protein